MNVKLVIPFIGKKDFNTLYLYNHYSNVGGSYK